MADKKVDYTENILEAMKIVSQSTVDSVRFDQTIKCMVVKNDEAADGIYTVSNGSAQFIAYSKDTDYDIDDNVMVTIPQGDYSQQKMIIGKYIQKNTTPYVYKDPLDYFVDMTGNLVTSSQSEYSILANFIPTHAIYPQSPVARWSNFGTNLIPLAGYDTLAIKADFMSWLKGFNTAGGNYGLKITITYLNTNTSVGDDKEHQNWYDGIMSAAAGTADSIVEAGMNNGAFAQKIFYFDVDDFYGDPYDYDTYYQQQALFAIGDLGAIVDIQVDLFQEVIEVNGLETGTFTDINGDLIPWYNDIFTDELLDNNIFVKDIYLSLGYDESQFDTDKLIIYSKNSLAYSSTIENNKNKKDIYARWIHKDENGEIVVINDTTTVSNTQLKWYRYKLSFVGDGTGGPSWQPLGTTQNNNEVFDAYIDANNPFHCILTPNTSLANEQIKLVITYGDTNTRLSEIITFTNEQDVPSEVSSRQLSDFYLLPNDKEKGVYNIYDNTNTITTQLFTNSDNSQETINPEKKIRALIPRLKDDDGQISNIEYIKWTIPTSFSMFHPVNKEGNTLFYTDITGVHINEFNLDRGIASGGSTIIRWNSSIDSANNIILEYGNDDNEYNKITDFDWNFYYTIDAKYKNIYTNNVVTCEIIKDRIRYTASFIFTFGYNSTNGSDYTLNVIFEPVEEGRRIEYAICTDTNALGKIKLNLSITDQNNNILDWDDNNGLLASAQVEWKWLYHVAPGSYQTQYHYIAHDNIPQYRKELDDINIDDDKALTPRYYAIRKVETSNTLLSDYADDKVPYETCLPSADLSQPDDEENGAGLGKYDSKLTYAIKTHPMETPVDHIGYSKTATGTLAALPSTGVKENRLSSLYLGALNGISMNEIYALEITVSGLVPYDLVTYVPIPLYKRYITQNDTVYIPNYVGPTLVRYDSAGGVEYFKDPCKLTLMNLGAAAVLAEENTLSVDFLFNIFNPQVNAGGYNQFDNGINYGILRNDILQPVSTFIKDNNPPYGIQAVNNGTIYWTQPIICYQNLYPNGTVNKWDGVGLLLNEEEGYILGHSISAGKKESDNTFTGVMLGDLASSQTNLEGTISKQTGVYGFHHGSLSYAFKDDGTGFIGKSGKGRIYFDGNKAVIRSGAWDISYKQHPNAALNEHSGMYLDLDDGFIKMIKPGYYSVQTVDDEEDYEEKCDTGLYRYIPYQFATSYKSDDTYYLPRIFLDPTEPDDSTVIKEVNDDNYLPNKFYIEIISYERNGDQDYTIDNSPEKTVLPLYNNNVDNGNRLLEGTTVSVQSDINRMDNYNTQPAITYNIKIYKYIITSDTEITKYLRRTEYYTYFLATDTSYNSNYTYKLPDTDTFTPLTDEEKNKINTISYLDSENNRILNYDWLYENYQEYVLCISDNDHYDAFRVYYSQDTASRFIDLGVSQPTYPFAIGRQQALGSRPFRVNWDGKVWITDGDFSGHINAKTGTLGNLKITGQLVAGNHKPSNNHPGIFGAYIEGGTISGTKVFAEELEADIGEIGGWTITNYGLYNRQYERGGTALGQIYLSSDNRNNGANSGIYLYNSALKVYPFRNSAEGGYVGWIGETNSGGIGFGYTTSLVGSSGLLNNGHSNYMISDSWASSMKYSYNGNVVGYITVSRGSLGVGDASIYIDCNNEILIGSLTYNSSLNNYIGPSVQIEAGDSTITMWHGFRVNTKNSNYGPNGQLFEIRKGNGYYWEMECWIPATMQHGIYARFA